MPQSTRSTCLRLACLLFALGFSGFGVHADESPYVAMDAKGKPAAPKSGARPHACVLDKTSQLVWEVKTGDGGVGDKDWIYSWYDKSRAEQNLPVGYQDSGRCVPKGHCDTASYVADVNKRGLCGFRDWRLPTAAELETLLRPEASGAKINTDFFPNTQAGYFWTGDYIPSEVGGALLVSFELGLTLEGNSASGAYVRLVRRAMAR